MFKRIYKKVSDISGTVQPNITFIIDTSGSMSSLVTLPAASYDPNQTYSGSCNSNRIYWSSNGKAPSCSTSNWFATSSNNCQDSLASLSSSGAGYYVGRAARYRIRKKKNDVWTTLTNKNHTDIVECAADYGVHGDGGVETYPANENKGGPYTSNSSKSINWSKTGRSYTLFSANYLNWKATAGEPVQKTRLEIVKEVFSDLIDSTSGVNASVVRFDDKSHIYNEGGYFLTPMQPVDDSTRVNFKAKVNSLTHQGWTPLAETLYEVTQFHRGGNVKFGDKTDPGTNDPGVLDPDNNSKYKSPIDYQCQKNFTVLLTDGQPTYDDDADNAISNLPGFTPIAGSCDHTDGDNCLDEVAHYLYEVDQRPDLPGKQNVITHTIGFHTDQKLLSDAARKGGGQYHTADDVSNLTDAFTSIITEILAVNTMFVAPAIPVNAFNRLSHRGELYYALFRPSDTAKWSGNVKRYALDGTPPDVMDAKGELAVDANTGFFNTFSTSFWTADEDGPDGDSVDKGGAASRLTLSRDIFTYTGSTAPNNVSLTNSEHRLHEDNALITKALLDIEGKDDAYRTSVLQWFRGVDIFDEDEDDSTVDARRQMGDALHSTPVLVNYGGTEAEPDITLYVATNEGLLHAINTRDGSEEFAFAPQELLPNVNTFYTNANATEHPYGLDGPITAWVNDVNGNGVVLDTQGNLEDNEHVYLYVGMRRGGKNYYALDVSDRNSPKLKWILKGGEGDFAELGQTWSRPSMAKIKFDGTERDVLFFGGGYDTLQDETDEPTEDDTGRAIFMVDAETGQRLWWASQADSNLDQPFMTNAIAGGLTIADMNGDGLSDVMFASDMAGQLWRFDINHDNHGASDIITGGRIADFGGTNAANNRRFYYKPDVSVIQRNGKTQFAISIGSGYRAHPLSKMTQDRFYTLFNASPFAAPESYTTAYESDLTDVTSDINPTLTESAGWYISLNASAGEKILSEARTFDGVTMVTSFTPVSAAQGACAPSQGVGTVYMVRTDNAAPAFDLDPTTYTLLELEDRTMTLSRGGIPPEVTVLFPPGGGKPIVIVGAEQIKAAKFELALKRTAWRVEYE